MCGELLILLEDELSRLACLPSEPEPIEHSDAGAQIDCRRRKTQADSPAFLPGYWVSERSALRRPISPTWKTDTGGRRLICCFAWPMNELNVRPGKLALQAYPILAKFGLK